MEQKKILQDVKNLAALTEEDEFETAKNMTIRKWNSFAPNFSDYF